MMRTSLLVFYVSASSLVAYTDTTRNQHVVSAPVPVVMTHNNSNVAQPPVQTNTAIRAFASITRIFTEAFLYCQRY